MDAAIAQDSLYLLLVTGNPNKIKETRAVSEALGLADRIKIDGYAPAWDVEESADTLIGNARLKLEAAIKQRDSLPEGVTHLVAEDAGVVVAALSGRQGLDAFPGVHANRWLEKEAELKATVAAEAGDNASKARNLAILKLLEGNPNRAAEYVAVLVAAPLTAPENVLVGEGRLSLEVGTAHTEGEGFGYDFIMHRPGVEHSLAEEGLFIKNKFSHRRRAWDALLAQLIL